jgi:hypothetical protein
MLSRLQYITYLAFFVTIFTSKIYFSKGKNYFGKNDPALKRCVLHKVRLAITCMYICTK